MRWLRYIVIAAIVCCAAAGAGPVDATLDRAALLLKSGQPEDALRHCLELRVEYPESGELLFAIGTAEAALAELRLRASDPEAAATYFRRARETFARTAPNPGSPVGTAATYNAATCLLRLDETLPKESYAARTENLQEAIAALEECLAHAPEMERARKNLDYARYTLNRLLQHPHQDTPPEGSEEDDDATAASSVSNATTQIPGANVEVLEGSMVVLQRPANAETPP